MIRLPNHWGAFKGIEGLPLIIVASNAVVYVFELFNHGLMPLLHLTPQGVYAGEVWRFITFLFVPPPLQPFFMFFWLYLLYTYASALEMEWGTFRFTVYYLVGAAATLLVGFCPVIGIVSNVYLNASLFLAFATLFPNFELLLFFFLPVKVKYIGYLTWAWIILSFFTSGLLTRLTILAALLNYFLLLGPDIWESLKLRWQVYQNRKRWRQGISSD